MVLTKKQCVKILRNKDKYSKLLIQKAQQVIDEEAIASTNQS